MELTFKRHHAEEILKHCGIENYITIDERGVWPKIEYDATMPVDSGLMRWRPARVFQGETGAPEVNDTPMIPFPFTASELAAFMLEGVGAFVLDTYGSSSDGPDPISLKQIDPDSKARTALIQAYAAYREAQTVAEAYPLALEAEADRARIAYNLANNEANEREGVFTAMPGTEDSTVRRKRAVASIAALDEAMEATARKWKLEHEKWLKAVVKQLLQPAQNTATPPAPVVAVVELVEYDEAVPVKGGLLTKEIADIFDGVNGWDAKRWPKNLSASNWLRPARTALGGAGVASSVWNPLTLAQLLHDRTKGAKLKEKLMQSLKSRFSRYPALEPWRDDFNEYFTTFCTTD